MIITPREQQLILSDVWSTARTERIDGRWHVLLSNAEREVCVRKVRTMIEAVDVVHQLCQLLDLATPSEHN